MIEKIFCFIILMSASIGTVAVVVGIIMAAGTASYSAGQRVVRSGHLITNTGLCFNGLY